MHDALTVVTSDGRTLAYAERGNSTGPVLFSFHGTPGCRLDRDSLDEATDARVIAIDRPGYGQSSPQPGRRLVDWPADVLAVADALGIERFSVLGTSGGGPYALACAALIPHRLHRVGVMCGVGPLSEAWTDEGTSAQNIATATMARQAPDGLLVIGEAIAAAVTAAPDAASFFAAGPVGEEPEVDRVVVANPAVQEMLFRGLQESMRQGGVGFADDYRVLAQPWGLDLASITVEVFMVHGSDDTNVPVAHARWVAEQVPGSVLEVVAGEGHLSVVANHSAALRRRLVTATQGD